MRERTPTRGGPLPREKKRPGWLGQNVVILGWVSFLNDLASEMIYPLLPAFLTSTLGVSATAIGGIEGAAESVSSLLKVGAGWISDRVGRRKPLVVLGYTIASAARPLVSVATGAGQVLAIRVSDRVGKGLRTPPRDALLADTVTGNSLGKAFGFQRAMDNAGAIVGPLVATALLGTFHLPLRTVFALAAVPGLLTILLLVAGVRESSHSKSSDANSKSSGAKGSPEGERTHASAHASGARTPRSFHVFLAIVLLFTLGNSSDAFLLLRARELGVPLATLPLLWVVFHVVKASLGVPAGALSDRFGRKGVILAGWLIYAVVYAGLARADSVRAVWGWMCLYGVYFALTEGVEKALVADLVPRGRRGKAYGLFNAAIGIGALPASLLMGILWDRFGPPVAFGFGATLALLAAVLLALLVEAPKREATALS